jgi:lipopolysaccharide/colanic/teichoic acid biosynthesis glycosyltransferase
MEAFSSHAITQNDAGREHGTGFEGELDANTQRPGLAPALIEQRVDDMWYIDNWSFRLDLATLLRTPIVVLRGRNAY